MSIESSIAIIKAMAKNTAANASNESANEETPKRKATQEGGKQWVYITAHVKHNGTFYKDTAVEIDSATARRLINDESAREATQEEIDAAMESIEDQRTPITEKTETLRALGVEPAVDEDGNVIPNSFRTRETKLRNEEGNTLEGASVNEADELDEDENPEMTDEPGLSNAAMANVPDTSEDAAKAKQSKGRRI